jgi:crossover junction endodeoxyribonuclease RuvC
MRILGIDPGSRLTGYGCVDVVGSKLSHVGHGTLYLASTSGKATVPLEDRLLLLYEGLSKVIQEYKPEVMAVEKVFFAKNAVSALKLGQARGAVILTGKIHGLSIVEYSPNEVKQTVVGQGHADKEQVARMIQVILKIPVGKQDFETADASDGLALAICHAYAARTIGSGGSEYAKALGKASGKRSKKSSSMSLAESLGITADQISPGQRRLNLSKE